MESLVLLIAIVAIFWVVFWALHNEKAQSIADQKGFFRMRPPAGSATDPREPKTSSSNDAKKIKE